MDHSEEYTIKHEESLDDNVIAMLLGFDGIQQ
jgi:hypothetical protein